MARGTTMLDHALCQRQKLINKANTFTSDTHVRALRAQLKQQRKINVYLAFNVAASGEAQTEQAVTYITTASL